MINKITIKNGAKIIDNNYVIKKKKRDLSNTYNYQYLLPYKRLSYYAKG